MISRADKKQMLKILKYLISTEGDVGFNVNEEGDNLYATVGGPTEEGYSYTTYQVYPQEFHGEAGDGWYGFSEYTRSRDCDGRMDNEHHGTVKLLDKAKRRYTGATKHGWTPDGKRGQFVSVRLRFGKVNSRQRDYSAEAMGY